MKIRLLYLINSFGPGGLEKVVLEILRNINYDIFDISVCTLCDENIYLDVLAKYPIKLFSLSMDSTSLRLPKMQNAIKMYKLVSIIKMVRPQLLHTQGFDPDFYGQIIGKILNVPIIISTLHGDDALRYNRRAASWKYQLKLLLEDYTVKYCNKIIAVSQSVQNYSINLRNIPKSKTLIIRNTVPSIIKNGANKNFVKYLFGSNQITIIGTICRLVPHKNILLALESFKHIYSKYPNTRFLIVGDGPERQMLHQYVIDNELSSSVLFVGFQLEIQKYLEVFDVMLITSYIEGLPLSLLEAMSIGVPVVSSNVSGIPELIKHEYSGLLVPSIGESHLAKVIAGKATHDLTYSNNYAEAIERIICNKSFSNMLITNAKKTIEDECSLKSNINKLEELYLSLMKK